MQEARVSKLISKIVWKCLLLTIICDAFCTCLLNAKIKFPGNNLQHLS